MQIKRPAHPVGKLTTYELAAWRRELERYLAGLPADAPERERLRQDLAEAIGEQRSRADGARAGRERT